MQDKNREENKPELLVLCQLFYPELVSTGQTMTELCEVLSEMGVDVEVLCGPPTVIGRRKKISKKMEHKGIRIKRVWGTRFLKLSFWGKLINQLTYAWSAFLNLLCDFSKRPVLVLTNPPFLGVICAFLKKIRLGKPYIYLVFDVYPDTAEKLGVLKARGFIAWVWNWFNRFVYKNASCIIVIGRCMKEVIKGKIKKGTAADKIRTIHVWSDDELIRSAKGKKNPFIEEWNLEGKFVVSYSGNMGRFHDMETIMEAVKILKDEEGIEFLFIGEGYKKQWTIDYAEKEDLKNCQFHTYVEREDLGFALSCADVGLVSLVKGQEGLSVPSKTFGLMAAEVPVLAVMSEFSEIARIVKEEDCGIVIEQGDAQGLADGILELYKDRNKLKKMGGNARRAIDEKYNLKKAAEKYYALIKEFQY